MLSNEFDVVCLSPSDPREVDGFASLLSPYFKEIDPLEDFDETRYLASVLRRLPEPGRWCLFARTRTAEPAGFSYFKIDRNERIGLGCILELYVRPQSRRQGLGRRLVEQSCRLLADAGIQQVWLTCCDDAGAFWQRCGFRSTGEICRNGLPVMVKDLKAGGRAEDGLADSPNS